MQIPIFFHWSFTKSEMGGIFRFKEFNVDQTGCGMKVNTDGVLLGALTGEGAPGTILDIGAGTGVIALMLAQRFSEACIDAIEIDTDAAATALSNFKNSPFSERLRLHQGSFQEYMGRDLPVQYDLIVSNPPFFITSLANNDHKKKTARHTDTSFFSDLALLSARHLSPSGKISLILPVSTAETAAKLAIKEGLSVHEEIEIKSFSNSNPHRKIITFGFTSKIKTHRSFVIYQQEKQYSLEYQQALKDFFIIF